MFNVYVRNRVGAMQKCRSDRMINGFKSDSTAVVIRYCQLSKNVFHQNVTRVENVFHMRSSDCLYHWNWCSFMTDMCLLLQTQALVHTACCAKYRCWNCVTRKVFFHVPYFLLLTFFFLWRLQPNRWLWPPHSWGFSRSHTATHHSR